MTRPSAPREATVRPGRDGPSRGDTARTPSGRPSDRDTAADKVLRLLLAFGDARPAALSDLARDAELPKSTTHRLLGTLQRHDLVERTEHGAYRLGLGAWKLGRRSRPYDAVARLAAPRLDALTAASGETSFLTVSETDHAVCVATAQSPRLMRLSLEPGTLVPMHLGASNRILLAFLPDGERDRVVRRWTEGEAERTALEEDLRRIRRDRYVVSSSQLTSGATAVAVPVLDEKGDLVAGLSLGGPTDRFDASAALAFLDDLRGHAEALAHDVAPHARHATTP